MATLGRELQMVTGTKLTAFYATAAFALSISSAISASAATPAADYRVNDVYTSSVGTIGPLVPIGTALSFISDTVDTQTQEVLSLSGDTTTGVQSGVQAKTNSFISSTNYSIVLLASVTLNTNLVATKIFDFKNLSSDDGLYINDTTGLLDFNGVATAIGGTPVVSGQYAQVVLTRTSAGLTTVYENGTQAFQFNDTLNQAVLGDATNTGNAFLTLFKDDGTGLGAPLVEETTVGNIARLRLYDGALTASEVSALDRTVVPEPATGFVFAASLLAMLPRRRQVKNA